MARPPSQISFSPGYDRVWIFNFQLADEILGGLEIEGFGGRLAPVENGGFEGKVRDDGGEIGGGAVGESGFEGERKASTDGITVESVAGGDNYRVGHERT